MHYAEVVALTRSIPDYMEIDGSDADVGQALTRRDQWFILPDHYRRRVRGGYLLHCDPG